MKRLLIAIVAISVTWCGCGGGGSKSTTSTPQAQITISPAAPQIRAGSTQLFTAQVSNSSTNAVSWAVNGTTGGSSAIGTIDANGLYTAPASLPTPNTVTVSASLSSNSTVTANTVATLLNPVPAISSAAVAAVIPSAFGINVTGSGFVNGTRLLLGGNAITTTVLSSTRLTAQALGISGNTSFSFQVSNPDPGAANSNTVTVAATSLTPANVTANSRLLDQASWGPTLADIARVQSLGLQGWIALESMLK